MCNTPLFLEVALFDAQWRHEGRAAAIRRRIAPLVTPIARACSYPYLRQFFSAMFNKQDSRAEGKY